MAVQQGERHVMSSTVIRLPPILTSRLCSARAQWRSLLYGNMNNTVIKVNVLTSCGRAYGRRPGPSTPAAISSGGTPCIIWGANRPGYPAVKQHTFLSPNAMHSAMLSQDVRPSVCLSVTRRYSVKTAKCIVNLFHLRVATPFYFLQTKIYRNIPPGTHQIGAFWKLVLIHTRLLMTLTDLPQSTLYTVTADRFTGWAKLNEASLHFCL